MKIMISIVAMASLFTSCANNSESASGADTVKSITPPPTSDSANAVAPMMGDTSKTEADSLEK